MLSGDHNRKHKSRYFKDLGQQSIRQGAHRSMSIMHDMHLSKQCKYFFSNISTSLIIINVFINVHINEYHCVILMCHTKNVLSYKVIASWCVCLHKVCQSYNLIMLLFWHLSLAMCVKMHAKRPHVAAST